MSSMFHVGQKVTPKKGGDWNVLIGGQRSGPEFGRVYTVIEIYPAVWNTGEQIVCLVFADWPTAGWDSDDFRPVTDISSLEALLNAKPSDLPAEPAEPRVPVLNWMG